MPESRSILHWAGLLAGVSIVRSPAFRSNPSAPRVVEQSNAGHYTRARFWKEVIFRGYLLTAALMLTRHLSLSGSGSVACSIVATAVVFSIAHLTTAGTTAIQLCCIGLRLPVRFSAIPAWIDRGSGSCPCRVQSVHFTSATGAGFRAERHVLGVRDFGKFPRILASGAIRGGHQETISGCYGLPFRFSPLSMGTVLHLRLSPSAATRTSVSVPFSMGTVLHQLLNSHILQHLQRVREAFSSQIQFLRQTAPDLRILSLPYVSAIVCILAFFTPLLTSVGSGRHPSRQIRASQPLPGGPRAARFRQWEPEIPSIRNPVDESTLDCLGQLSLDQQRIACELESWLCQPLQRSA